MSLTQYNEKRKFSDTPEPEGSLKSSKGKLRFVVQKHDASQVHYDFRLEIDGVLKSWAVPKGPSLNPVDKRLAMQVEDHPYDYRNFEGVIPEGNYGAGTVIVWDEGTYEPIAAESTGEKQLNQTLLQQYENGKMEIRLHGKKLQGIFTLFQMKGREKSWLLVKQKDEFASKKDITAENLSVKSGKTLKEIATENNTVLNHPEEGHSSGKIPVKTGGKAKQKKEESAIRKTIVKKAANSSLKIKKAADAPIRKIKPQDLSDAQDAEAEIILNRHTVKLTNLTKQYWKKESFTKGNLLNYYLEAAPYILPYMKDRPQSLHRHPNGINGKSFFQKDMRGKLPDWIPTHEDYSESTEEMIEYMVCNNEATLLYMANLGCIEMHPWHSRRKHPDLPDYCIIDLDPDKSNTFNQVIETAHMVKALLDDLKATCYCKTSGSTGLHIYIPLGAKYTYGDSKQFAEKLVNLVNQELPDTTSVDRNPAKRKGKIYLDFLQNRQTQTAVAPYSLRPKPGMPVSTPLDWAEVKKGLTPTTYNATNIFNRLKTEGDLFTPVLGKGVDLKKILNRLMV